jgi:carbonic anhydrase
MLLDRASMTLVFQSVEDATFKGGFHMGGSSEHSLGCNCMGRRNFLKVARGAALVGISSGTVLLAEQARADALTKELRDKLTPAQTRQ